MAFIKPWQSWCLISKAKIDDAFYCRIMSETIKALMYAPIALKGMSRKEYLSCRDVFFLKTKAGLIAGKRLNSLVKDVLHTFLKHVTDSNDQHL
jgi:hypothetical protein